MDEEKKSLKVEESLNKAERAIFGISCNKKRELKLFSIRYILKYRAELIFYLFKPDLSLAHAGIIKTLLENLTKLASLIFFNLLDKRHDFYMKKCTRFTSFAKALSLLISHVRQQKINVYVTPHNFFF